MNGAQQRNVVKLTEFLDRHGPKLAATIENNLNPIYNPLKPIGIDQFTKNIFMLRREPLKVQGEVIKAVSKALYQENVRNLFIGGEMGVGKTLVALSIIHCAPAPMRSLVVCPTHLVEKWIREIKATIPQVRTVDLTVPNVITILEGFRNERKKPDCHEIFVISKEKAKLSYGWRPAVVFKRNSAIPCCPDCLSYIKKDDYYLFLDDLKKKKYFCPECKTALWQADKKMHRYSPAEYIKKYLKGYFQMVIIDEIQDYKAEGTLQGRAMGSLVGSSLYTLCLTGTLNGGYADDLFHLLFRMDPESLKRDGFDYHSANSFLATFGTLEKVRKVEEEDAQYGRGKKNKELIKKRPGVSPAAIGKYLLDKAVFFRLADVIDGLPQYEENVLNYQMVGEQASAYRHFENKLKDAVSRHGSRALAAKLQALLSYPDSCSLFEEEVVIKNRIGEVALIIRAPKINLPEGTYLPKEEDFIKIVKKEKAEDRKVLCYLTFTNSRDIRPRLKEILEKEGIRVGILDVSVSPKKREAWVKAHVDDIDVLICNAELVKTGLDLYDFPTIYFYQTGYNIFTLRQAARRSWRIGQRKPVHVYFAVYQLTMQEVAISLIAKKLEVALAVEGDIPEGLAEYGCEMGSITQEMCKVLVEGGDYTGAEKAWANFRKKEIESQLGLGGKESIFYQQPEKADTEVLEHTRVAIQDNVFVKVAFIDGKRKKRSVVEVRYEDMETMAKGRPIQLAMF